jgi:hypothetical protein
LEDAWIETKINKSYHTTGWRQWENEVGVISATQMRRVFETADFNVFSYPTVATAMNG